VKTPLTYYGGKQNMADLIVSFLPKHHIYCEPFAGGAAVLFAKNPSPKEILNDLNIEVANFWEVLKRDFDALAEEVFLSLHSRKLFKSAGVVYTNPDMFDRVKRAWAVWYLANSAFGSMLDGSWGSDVGGKRVSALKNKRAEFLVKLSHRLQNVRIENYDAIKVIKDNDSIDTLYYIDPPYVGADQGHYAGYTQSDFNSLLEALTKIRGKFLLSSYSNDRLSNFVKEYKWCQTEIKMNNSMSSSQVGRKVIKTEILTANYAIYEFGTPDMFSLFEKSD
jgi:DNA adenine methylase